jgi:hypothetical protein
MSQMPETTRQGSHLGVAYRIEPRAPLPGIGWVIPRKGPRGVDRPIRSSGAFYSEMLPSHPTWLASPPCAYDAAEVAVRSYIERNLGVSR